MIHPPLPVQHPLSRWVGLVIVRNSVAGFLPPSNDGRCSLWWFCEVGNGYNVFERGRPFNLSRSSEYTFCFDEYYRLGPECRKQAITRLKNGWERGLETLCPRKAHLWIVQPLKAHNPFWNQWLIRRGKVLVLPHRSPSEFFFLFQSIITLGVGTRDTECNKLVYQDAIGLKRDISTSAECLWIKQGWVRAKGCTLYGSRDGGPPDDSVIILRPADN